MSQPIKTGTTTATTPVAAKIGFEINHGFADAESDIEFYLISALGLSEFRANELLRLGSVYVDSVRARRNYRVALGSYVRTHLDPRRYDTASIDWRTRIVHETEEFLIVDKPAGIPVHAMIDNQAENVLTSLAETIGAPTYVTHRLDIPTQGLMVVAKMPAFRARFNRLLAERKIQKRYRALTESALPEGTITHYFDPGPRSPRKAQTQSHDGWDHAQLRIERVAKFGTFFESEIELLTGRTHQIRCQLSASGAPILGDSLYGGSTTVSDHNDARIALQAFEIRFSDKLVDYSWTLGRNW